MDDLHRGLARLVSHYRGSARAQAARSMRRDREKQAQVTKLAGALGYSGINREADFDKLIAQVLRMRADLAEIKASAGAEVQ
jgi:hypothetical protein